MAFHSKVSRIVDVRPFFAVFRSPLVRRTRTLTSQSKESAWYFRFAGPFVIWATAAGAGLFAASRLYNNNFTFFGNVHAATKVICLDMRCCIYMYSYRYGILLRPQRNICLRWDVCWPQNFDTHGSLTLLDSQLRFYW